MGDRQRANEGAGPVRPGFAFDEAQLAQWMRDHVEDFAGPLQVQQFQGGQSNPTYKLLTPTRAYVMRRRPTGKLVEGAHAIDREYKVLHALWGTGFPVPRPYGLCLDDSVIGSGFYIMAMADGRMFWETSFPGAAREERPRYFEAMCETIARLHAVDIDAVGLTDFGRHGNYIERQIKRWTRQYQEGIENGGRDANLDRLIEWLSANVPQGDETTIIHGDFRCDNMIFHPLEPKVIAVIDWELSTLGHPLADFAFNAMMYRVPPELITGLVGIDLETLNIPSEHSYIEKYCRLTGRTDIPHYDFYVIFNLFRLAAILHGIKGRVAIGNAASPHARHVASHVEPLARIAWEQASAI
jgi:aminoglycoside phosphotransferase (APT) family kinase protein